MRFFFVLSRGYQILAVRSKLNDVLSTERYSAICTPFFCESDRRWLNLRGAKKKSQLKKKLSILIQVQHSGKKDKYCKQTDRCLNRGNLANNEMRLCKSENSTPKVVVINRVHFSWHHPSLLTKLYLKIIPLEKSSTFF